MADTPQTVLVFQNGCPDCGQRKVELPPPLPGPGDDFDWTARDFDGLRRFILEELAARFPDRRRWTPADMEVALVEVLAALLDQLSDMADRVFAEAYLETARRPDSVRRLLGMIGYDAVAAADALGQIEVAEETSDAEAFALLESFWADNPYEMERARLAGPVAIRTQHRMVTVQDYAERLEDHPLVVRATAWLRWTGAWSTIDVAVVLWDTTLALDGRVPDPDEADSVPLAQRIRRLQADIVRFHEERRLPVPDWTSHPTARTVLRPYLDAYRMTGQEVILRDAAPVGITIIASLVVDPNYFQSEVRVAAEQALGREPGGFFEPGRLRFGEDLFASDVIATLMALDGVRNVCLIRFKRAGIRNPDQSQSGRITLEGLEIAVCDNDPARPERGYVSVRTHGGRSG